MASSTTATNVRNGNKPKTIVSTGSSHRGAILMRMDGGAAGGEGAGVALLITVGLWRLCLRAYRTSHHRR